MCVIVHVCYYSHTHTSMLVYKDRVVLCIVVGCSKRYGQDGDVSLYRLPKVISNKGSRIKRGAGYVGVI